MSINELEYYFSQSFSNFLNKFKNTKIQKAVFYLNDIHNKKSLKRIEHICGKCKYLSKEDYNKYINIDEVNQYTVLKINIDSSKTLNEMVKKCLKNTLKTEKILINNKPIHMKNCVIIDVVNITNSISSFHTDYEYSTFTGDAFNVWYLIENNESYGNMFLLQSSDYKKKYTPCTSNDDNNNKSLLTINDNTYFTSFFKLKPRKIGHLNKDNIKITYTNIKNGECIIMTKHLLHRGDHRRNNNVNGFHFRVLVKNEDGSIDYNKYYKPSDKFPNHRWDQENKKLYGVELFDFA